MERADIKLNVNMRNEILEHQNEAAFGDVV